MSDHFDLVVIGSGPAGEKGAAQAAYFGKRVCIIERAPKPGGAQMNETFIGEGHRIPGFLQEQNRSPRVDLVRRSDGLLDE